MRSSVISIDENREILSPSGIVPLEFDRNKVPTGVKKKKKLKYDLSRNISIPIAIRKSIVEKSDTEDTVSTTSEVSSNYIPNKVSKKLLSGFHLIVDEDSELFTLQCSTCCVGWWRQYSRRCAKCETFISFPIYFWVCN